jgi:catechol 2,3-dioxygenase-like lactoylglutathione lyase family enzyme
VPLPIHVNGLDHVVLKVSDVQRSLAFFEGVLGLRLERIFEELGVYQVRCGANLIDLQVLKAGESLPPAESRGLDHVCISVDGEVDAVMAALEAAKVTIVRKPVEVYGARGFGTSIYIADPDGYVIELKFGYCVTPVRLVPGKPPEKQ